MNIIGEGFPDEIINQVDQRQKIYGSGFVTDSVRTSEQIIYLNGNTSWCKLVSSVDITNPEIVINDTIKNLNLTGNKLAKKFILFNGVTDIDRNLRSGINYTNDILGNNHAYGIGGTEFGLRPMMGIQSAHIKHENRGSIRRATVKIKAFNKQQFDIIDILYLRLGFDILLEWGHSMYYDNKGVLQKNVNNSLARQFLDINGSVTSETATGTGQTGNKIPSFYKNEEGIIVVTNSPTVSTEDGNVLVESNPTKLTYIQFLELIRLKRLSSCGNYDAMFAKVVNYHWSFMPDGSYDITLDLVSVGDVVESFKINALSGYAELDDPVPGEPPDLSKLTDAEIITLFANENAIGTYFYQIINVSGLFDAAIADPAAPLIGVEYNEDHGTYWYIKLGSLLEYIQNNIMYLIEIDSETSSLMLKFDTTVETNLMFIEDLQVSTDPNICLVNRTIVDSSYGSAENIGFTPDQAAPFESQIIPGYRCYGQIMNIYVNMKYVLLELDRLKNATNNKVVLIDFLNNILSSISSALGGVNKLETTIDETTNTITIRDANPLPNKDEVITAINKFYKTNSINRQIPENNVIFDLYRYNTSGHASFIKDFNFTTEINPGLSTTLTVGATSNGRVVGENSTAFSRFNRGLTDRFKVSVKEPNSLNFDPATLGINFDSPEDEKNLLIKKFGEGYLDFVDYLRGIAITVGGIYKDPDDVEFQPEKATVYKTALTNYLTFLQQIRPQIIEYFDKLTPGESKKYLKTYLGGSGFIPFNMSITMDGLSGMKIYSKFNIDTEFLPSNYPDEAEFLIKNIEHKIENNKWYTTLESFVTIKGEYKDKNSDIFSENPFGVPIDIVDFDDLLDYSKFVYPNSGNVIRVLNRTTKHLGIDIAEPIGQLVVSACSGVVTDIIDSGPLDFGPHWVLIKVDPSNYLDPADAYGRKQVYCSYGHMSAHTVTVGKVVRAGEPIGLIGNEGKSSGPHLHFEIRGGTNYRGKAIRGGSDLYVDPSPYFRSSPVVINTPFKT